MLVKVVACTLYEHALKIGSIAIVLRSSYYPTTGRSYDCQSLSTWSGRPLEQVLASRDVRRIPHNKANLRAFAKQQGYQYKKR